ncbi:hypothetical protein P167DRAFT_536678 [Morchella conica CCBAS932]|uniref:C2H2-type domain-containing protein n=1 Tax=Morchella conica CCBAS932 TaxID=1392247 RepID=A0A3N4KQC4_9PEZI|nr:hypothetical protein P167DRAFT_536678 [Morchella conica CCBAS932]
MASTVCGNISLSGPAAIANPEWNHTRPIQIGDYQYDKYAQKISYSAGNSLGLLDWQQSNCNYSSRDPNADNLPDFNDGLAIDSYESPYYRYLSQTNSIILPGLEAGSGDSGTLHYPAASFENFSPVTDVPDCEPVQFPKRRADPGNFIPHYKTPRDSNVLNREPYYDQPSSCARSQYVPLSPDLLSPISPRYIIGKEELLIDDEQVPETPYPKAHQPDSFLCRNNCDGNYVGLHSCFRNGNELLIACRYNDRECSSTFATRNGFNPHFNSVHIQENPGPQVLIDCPVAGCARVGSRGFKRKDNMLQHRRGVHGEEIQKKYMRFGQAGLAHRKLRDVRKPGKRGKR